MAMFSSFEDRKLVSVELCHKNDVIPEGIKVPHIF